MTTLRHITPAFRVPCGPDSLRGLSFELERPGCRRAVLCGQRLAHRADGLGLEREALGEGYAGAFDGVTSHSPLPAVLAGTLALRDFEADAVVALGGGSAVVTARLRHTPRGRTGNTGLGLPRRLRDLGIPEDGLSLIAEDTAGDWFLHQNPRRVAGPGELLALLKAAW